MSLAPPSPRSIVRANAAASKHMDLLYWCDSGQRVPKKPVERVEQARRKAVVRHAAVRLSARSCSQRLRLL
eukprot:6180046-Pleurochrysis_carterae.AAC.3